jgi:hypothetical protein
MLDPDDGKLSRPVLRGERGRKLPDLLDYKDLCLNLNGDWINAGGDKRGLLNPLQIRPAPRDTDDRRDAGPNEKKNGVSADNDPPLYVDDGYGMSDMALHIKNLEIFFKLYVPSLSDMKRAILKQAIEAVCNLHLYGGSGGPAAIICTTCCTQAAFAA